MAKKDLEKQNLFRLKNEVRLQAVQNQQWNESNSAYTLLNFVSAFPQYFGLR